MITQTVTVTEKNAPNIIIGRRGTYNTEEIVFDLTYLVETFGSGSAVMMVKRPMDNTAYPAVTEQDGNTLTWTVSDIDTNFKGHGECELFWYVDDGLAKSLIWPLTILRDIGTTTEEPPEPYQTWVDDLTELGAETLQNAQSAAQSATSAGNAQTAAETAQGLAEDAQEAAEAAQAFLENASATATTLEPGSSATASYEDGVFTFGIPKGDPGDPATNLVTSVNGETGAVVLDATDVGAYALPSGGIPKTDLASSVQTSLGKADTALQTAPVTSVNTQIGDVVLDAGDIGYESTTVEDELGTINSALTSLSSVTEIIDTASGAIASFPDGSGLPMRSLVAQINPVQDLHGQSIPWPMGGGTNLLTTDGNNLPYSQQGITVTMNEDFSYKVTASQATGYPYARICQLNGLKAGIYTITPFVPSVITTRNFTFRIMDRTSGSSVGQATTSSVTFVVPEDIQNTLSVELALTGSEIPDGEFTIKCQLEKGSTASAWSPYANECPISGWTGLQGQRTGVNLFDKTTAVVGYIDDADGELKGTQAGSAYRSTDFVRVDGGKSYYIKTEQTASIWGAWYDENKAFISGQTNYANAVITAPNNAKYIRLTAVSSNNGNLDTFAINYPSTDTEYHAYTGEPISVSWEDEAGTVYGGTATYNGDGTWTLVAEKGIQAFAQSDFSYGSGSQAWYSDKLINMVGNTDDGVVADAISDSFKTLSYTAMSQDISLIGFAFRTTGRVFVRNGSSENAPTVNICYPLKTPVSYTITTGELIDTLYGQNNVFVDIGDVSVTYQASIKGYIDKVLGA